MVSFPKERGCELSNRFRSIIAVVLAVAMLATFAALGGCTTSEEKADEGGEGAVKGGTLSQFIVEPFAITPTLAYESEGIYIVSAMFDSLVEYDPITSELQPAAAESWSPNEDASVWTFNLRQGAKFHNGREVKAEDFKYAWERMLDPAMASEISYHLLAVKGATEMLEGQATELEGVKALDDYTLEVTLAEPYPDFELVVGHPCLGPLPKEAVDADPKFDENLIGNGPFKMAEPWVHDQYVKLVRFDDYYGDEPYVDGLEFKIFKDAETAFLEFEAGNLDFTEVPSGRLADVTAKYGEAPDGYTSNPGEQVLVGPELGIYYANINNTKAPFDNPKVREAINLAINRQAISDALFDGSRKPADSISPEGILGYEAGMWPQSRYDVEAAKAALADAGYPDGEGFPTIKLLFNTGSYHDQVWQLVQADLKAIGIESELDSAEWAVYKDKLKKKEFDIARYGWVYDYPIMENALYALFYSESADNQSYYVSEEFDAQVLKARSTLDLQERLAGMREADKILGKDMPVAPIMFYSHFDLTSDRVNDFVYSPMNIPDYVHCWISESTE